MMNIFTQPWPWYIAGPAIGLMVPLLLLLDNKAFGISSSLRHFCAACIPVKVKFFNYDWKKESWNMVFVIGMMVGGFVAGFILKNPDPIAISETTIKHMGDIGITDFSGLIPTQVFNFNSLFTLRGFILIVIGGFLVGFGTRYANGCTSGHSIMGMSNLQWPSFLATCCFFVGGLVMTWIILPYIMKL